MDAYEYVVGSKVSVTWFIDEARPISMSSSPKAGPSGSSNSCSNEEDASTPILDLERLCNLRLHPETHPLADDLLATEISGIFDDLEQMEELLADVAAGTPEQVRSFFGQAVQGVGYVMERVIEVMPLLELHMREALVLRLEGLSEWC